MHYFRCLCFSCRFGIVFKGRSGDFMELEVDGVVEKYAFSALF